MLRRQHVILLVVVVAVGVLAAAAAVVSARRHPETYASGTPQRVVQEYLSAVVKGETDRAMGLLVSDSPCTVGDLDAAYVGNVDRVVLRHASADETTARVDVDVVRASDDPIGATEWTERQTFRLVRESGAWRISGTPWPMPDCPGKA
jgi:hypothetical protein